VLAGVALYGLTATEPPPPFPAAAAGSGRPPPAEGYLSLRPVGSAARLPTDAAAARLVRPSSWEMRPENARFNRTAPPALRPVPRDPAARAYDPRWNRYVLGRITGRYTGTTDEIFQWAAAKWGLPDNLLRAIAVQETDWRQASSGDLATDQSQCPPGYRAPCPVTFGIVGTKSTSWPGIFPWNRDSTAAAVDALGGWLRGCYEGWVWWLRDHGSRANGVYAAGDLWGCVGAWATGDWHVNPRGGASYIERVQRTYATRPWLQPGFGR
jgi:autotransporter family porin